MGVMDDDAEAMLRDLAETEGRGVVVWNGQTLYAAFDRSDEVQTDTGSQTVIEGGIAITVSTRQIPSAASRNGPLTVDGVAYRMRDPLQLDDGVLTRVSLVKVSS